MVLIVEDLAHEESPEIHHEVFEGHPEDAVLLPNIVLLETSQHHPPLYDQGRSLGPFRRVVTPGSLPLTVVPPRVSQLNKLVAINIAHIEDAIGMAHDDPQLRTVIVAPWWATSTQNVVVFLCPHLK